MTYAGSLHGVNFYLFKIVHAIETGEPMLPMRRHQVLQNAIDCPIFNILYFDIEFHKCNSKRDIIGNWRISIEHTMPS